MTKFEKVTLDRFVTDGGEEAAYEGIKLPRRATAGSAGYDFYAPVKLVIRAGETVKITTGIRCAMERDLVLAIFPRSVTANILT